jgi:hypothetical protein
LIISNARVKAWISSRLGTPAAAREAGAGAALPAGAGTVAELSGGAAKATPQHANDRPQARTREYRVMGSTEEVA